MKKKSEHERQSQLISWCRMMSEGVCKNSPAYYPDLKKVFAIPNGGKRSKREASRLKAEGVRSGVLDLFLPVARDNYFGFWLEFKVEGNTLSDEQEIVASENKRDGYKVEVYRDPQIALNDLLDYLDKPKT
jgi:hypothetical protein